jgi:hypothetical protein
VGASLPFEPWAMSNKVPNNDLHDDQNVISETHCYSDLEIGLSATENDEDGDYIAKHVLATETILEDSPFSAGHSSDPVSINYGIAVSDETPFADAVRSISSQSAPDVSYPSFTCSPSASSFHSVDSDSDSHSYKDTFGKNDESRFSDVRLHSNPFSIRDSELLADLEWSSGSTSPSCDSDPTPFTSSHSSSSSYSDKMNAVFRPGSSVGTIRASARDSLDAWANERHTSKTYPGGASSEEPVDGTGSADRNGGHTSGRNGDAGNDRGWTGGQGGHTGDHGGNSHQQGASGGGKGGDDGDDDRPGAFRSSFSTPTDSDESNPEDSEDDYGNESAHRIEPNLAAKETGSGELSSGTSTTTDDDVPLAQRIPTALSAQKTIRRQVRDEKEARKRDRAARQKPVRSRDHGPSPPRTAGTSKSDVVITGSREPPVPATRPTQSDRNFVIEDLTQKLLSVQANESPPSALLPHKSSTSHPPSRDRPESIKSRVEHSSKVPDHHKDRQLRPQRSLQRPHAKDLDRQGYVPMPEANDQASSQSVTSSRLRRRTNDSEGSHGAKHRSATDDARHSMEKNSRSRSKEDDRRSARTSMDDASPPQKNTHRQPIPPVPSNVLASLASSAKSEASQQRIFIGDKERFNIVEILPSTNAQDVLDSLERQGAFDAFRGVGEWMVYEVCCLIYSLGRSHARS